MKTSDKMKKIFLTLIAATLIQPVALNAKPEKEEHVGLTAISYNIRVGTAKDGTNSWQYRYAASAMMILDQQPDILGLQEAVEDQYNYLKTTFEKKYKIVGVGRDDGKNKGERMAIMYNVKTVSLLKWGTFWLSETPEKPGMGWDAAYPRCATWALMKDKTTGKKFYYVNTHLDHIGPEAQKNGCQLIVDWLKEHNTDNLPVVITGDFNVEYNNPALAPLKAVASNARVAGVVTDDSATYNGWGKDFSTIDHIWFSGFSSCTKYETITKPYQDRAYISDHFPVKAVLIF